MFFEGKNRTKKQENEHGDIYLPSQLQRTNITPSEFCDIIYHYLGLFNMRMVGRGFALFFIYTIFQEGDTFGMKAILPCGPLNIQHMKNKQYTYIQIAIQTVHTV